MRVKIHCEVETSVPPYVIRDALLDFSDRRLQIWSATLDPESYEVHWVGETSAEVTEGSARPKVWSREHYDWSVPNTITWTAKESNFCMPGSGVSMVILPADGGGSHVAVTWDRTPSNLRGRLYLGIAAIGGHRLLAWAAKKALESLDATVR